MKSFEESKRKKKTLPNVDTRSPLTLPQLGTLENVNMKK